MIEFMIVVINIIIMIADVPTVIPAMIECQQTSTTTCVTLTGESVVSTIKQ
jgi:hypothetical protein